MGRFQDLLFDAQSVLVGLEGINEVFALEMKVADPVQQHRHLRVILAQRRLPNAKRLLVKLESLIVFFTLLVNLGNATEHHSNVTMILMELELGNPQEFLVQFNGPVQFSLLVKTLSSVECSRCVVNTVDTQPFLPYPESLFVIQEGLVEFIALYINSAQIVECGGNLFVVRSQDGHLDLQRFLEIPQGTLRLFRRDVIIENPDAVVRDTDIQVLRSLEDTCVPQRRLIGSDRSHEIA
mmetsp:Transcript_4585/g.7959  ORF Transcript_4585/g.7959 Transcript_4585/m.7959 type:complete len:238 (+) Transcript_4585:558-1271(+)